MLSALGDHRFDVTHRAVVIHRLDGSTLPAELCQQASSTPADALLLAVAGGGDDALPASTAAVREVTDRPVIVRTSDPDVLARCLSAGAAGAHLGAAADARSLELAAGAGATVVVARDETTPVDASGRADALVQLAAHARAAGIDADRVVVDVTPRAGGLRVAAAASLVELASVARAGCAAMVDLVASDTSGVEDGDDVEAELVAAATLLVAEGARLLVTDRPRAMRRVAAVLAELLAARGPAEVDP